LKKASDEHRVFEEKLRYQTTAYLQTSVPLDARFAFASF
tara:strand:- start:149 stop:265 length:117 start_codon:yes stop_codon:yes gene_type:complete